MKLPSPRHDGATPGWQGEAMTRKDSIMEFDFESFGERNAIRSALAGNPPGRFDRTEVLHLLRHIPHWPLRRAAGKREQPRAA